jgi:hypothetical protein
MSTLALNGSNQDITGVGQGPVNGPLSEAMLIKKTGNITGTLFTPYSGSLTSFTWYFTSGGQLAVYMDAVKLGSTVLTLNNWYLVAVTQTGYPGTPRFHLKNLTTDGPWVHENANGEIATAPPSSVGRTARIGSSPGVTQYLPAESGLFALWDGISLSNSEVEALGENKKTSDLNALSPSSLTEFRSTSPVDLKGLMEWTVNGATLTGEDPPDWNFDGLGSPPAQDAGSSVPVAILTSSGWVDLGGGSNVFEQPDEPMDANQGDFWVDTDAEPSEDGGVGMEVYEQLEEPVTDTIGALWVRQEPL